MKKICFVTTIYGTYKAFIWNFASYLHNTGEYEIYLICKEEEQIKTHLQDFVHYIPVKMERGISLSAFTSIKEMISVFKKYKFDIVQYSTPNASFYASIASKIAKIPVRLYALWGIRYMGFEGWRRVLFKTLEKITCKLSTYVEVESDNLRNFSLKEGLFSQDKSCVVWNGSASGVDFTKFDISSKEQWRKEIRTELNITDEEVVFSYAARLTADKGLNELLEAFFNLKEKYDNIRLIIMGGMDDEASLNAELMDKAEKSSKVIITGSVPDVEKYFSATDVFVSPSYREGFGLVVIEAESMGLPAIVSNVPGQIDAIVPEKTGLPCEVKDVQSLQKQMEVLINDKEQRTYLGNNARKFVEDNFEQQKLFEHLKKHKDDLIGE